MRRIARARTRASPEDHQPSVGRAESQSCASHVRLVWHAHDVRHTARHALFRRVRVRVSSMHLNSERTCDFQSDQCRLCGTNRAIRNARHRRNAPGLPGAKVPNRWRGACSPHTHTHSRTPGGDNEVSFERERNPRIRPQYRMLGPDTLFRDFRTATLCAYQTEREL